MRGVIVTEVLFFNCAELVSLNELSSSCIWSKMSCGFSYSLWIVTLFPESSITTAGVYKYASGNPVRFGLALGFVIR